MDVFELTLQTLERIMKAVEGMSIMLLDDHTVRQRANVGDTMSQA